MVLLLQEDGAKYLHPLFCAALSRYFADILSAVTHMAGAEHLLAEFMILLYS